MTAAKAATTAEMCIRDSNDISRFMLDSEDGGVFYCQGGGRGNVVDHNLITDYGNETSGGIGIYLDDRADYFTITNNIVAQGNTFKTYAAYFKGHDLSLIHI